MINLNFRYIATRIAITMLFASLFLQMRCSDDANKQDIDDDSDIDNDGDGDGDSDADSAPLEEIDDFVFAERFGPEESLIFSGSALLLTSDDFKSEPSLALGDMDNDGDLDVIMQEGFTGDYPNGRYGKFCLIENTGTPDSYVFESRQWYDHFYSESSA